MKYATTAARQCRGYRARTVDTVQRASSSWARCFKHELPVLSLDTSDCDSLARSVKQVLSECPSSLEEERMAWQSIKKLLPDSCRCMESPLIRKVAQGFRRPPVKLPVGYIEFVRKIVSRLFHYGWDSGVYEPRVLTTSPPLSGSTTTKRSCGGVLGSDIDHSSFLDICLRDNPDFRIDNRAELTVVQSAGKPRALSKFSADTLCLKPLHKAIYDRISRRRWICRGDVTTEKLRDAGFSVVEGDVFVSGDYKSATDGLSIEVAEAILDEILKNTVSVPNSMKRAARDILRPNLFSLVEGLDFKPRVGQMMGSYLSFPLLCIQNYVAFRYACHLENKTQLPVLINGDDILFQSTSDFGHKWMKVVQSLGLEVEKTKTSVSSEYASLNSTLLRPRDGRLAVVPTLRFGMLRQNDQFSIGQLYHDFVAGLKGDFRFRASNLFMSWHISVIRSSHYNTLELGFRGKLAYRVTRKWKLALGELEYTLPRPPTGHNISLSSDNCEFVDPESVSRDDKFLSNCQLAAWKFSSEYKNDLGRDKYRYVIELSAKRLHVPSFQETIYKVTTESRGQQLRRFLRNDGRRRDSFPLMIRRTEQLPTYEEATADFVYVEVATGDKKK